MAPELELTWVRRKASAVFKHTQHVPSYDCLHRLFLTGSSWRWCGSSSPSPGPTLGVQSSAVPVVIQSCTLLIWVSFLTLRYSKDLKYWIPHSALRVSWQCVGNGSEGSGKASRLTSDQRPQASGPHWDVLQRSALKELFMQWYMFSH